MGQSILLAVDGTDSSIPAIDKAISMAKESGRSITAIFVKEIGFRMKPSFYSLREVDMMAREIFTDVKSKADEAGVDIRFRVSIGHAARDIASISRNYDFVVCGTNRRTGIARLLQGSVSESLTRMSKCATMVVQC